MYKLLTDKTVSSTPLPKKHISSSKLTLITFTLANLHFMCKYLD